ncbi:MAG: ribonuclease P protein component [Peptococcaceae bacterium]|jgi:ribonuclease P protein component|nr:ribonuclease P protein component [Peptococcaceae bacterium]
MAKFITIKSNRDFRACYRKGRAKGSRLLVLYSRRRSGPEVRFGFVVSKKVGGAVQRNRVRRVLREACRLNGHLFPPGCDYVFVARPGSVALGLAEVRQIVLGLLKSL